MYLKYGNVWSTAFNIGHEYQTPHNPQGEWNMDSWNNNQGREIAKEIQKEYGNKFDTLSQQQRDDIIATKVMARMRSGQLIISPTDKRQYKGEVENLVNGLKNLKETNLPYTPTRSIGGIDKNGRPLGFAVDMDIQQLAKDLGLESFNMELPKMQKQQQNQSDLSGYTNPLTGSNHIYTREEIGQMSLDEYAKHEKEIDAQVEAMGGKMPTNGDLEREASRGGNVIYVQGYTRSDGTEVRGYYRSR